MTRTVVMRYLGAQSTPPSPTEECGAISISGTGDMGHGLPALAEEPPELPAAANQRRRGFRVTPGKPRIFDGDAREFLAFLISVTGA